MQVSKIIEEVILVDEHDEQIGVKEKLKAHREGDLHRAFSIFVYNPNGELLLQQRALNKYHSAGLWSNTCCGHPRPRESLEKAVHRRLQEEMGFDCELVQALNIIYNLDVGNGMREHEFCHAFLGISDTDPNPNREEVSDFRWMKTLDILKDIQENPNKYAPWFRLMITSHSLADTYYALTK